MVRFIIFLSLLLLVRLVFFYSQGYFLKNEGKRVETVSIASGVRERIADTFYKTLPTDDAALLIGIVFGGRGNFSPEYFDSIKKVGVLHVIAASGMNVTMVAGFISGLLVLFMRRPHALFAAAGGLLIYSALADFQPSIIRASIMASFAFGAQILGRQNSAVLALLFAAFVMIMIDPAVLEDIGFQLSFAATSGIILLDPIFKKLGKNIFFEDARTTISAQAATVPIIAFYFSSYSPISIIANLLILWTVPPLMILGGLASIVSLILPVAAAPFLLLSLPLLEYFKQVTLFLSRFALEANVENIPLALILGYYLVVLALTFALYKHLKIRL